MNDYGDTPIPRIWGWDVPRYPKGYMPVPYGHDGYHPGGGIPSPLGVLDLAPPCVGKEIDRHFRCNSADPWGFWPSYQDHYDHKGEGAVHWKARKRAGMLAS